MRVLVSGAGGLIGSRLRKELDSAGHEVTALVRREVKPGKREIRWDPSGYWIDREAIRTLEPEAVVHLAGHSIAGLWTPGHKSKVLESRRKGTSLLAGVIAELPVPPHVFISASAIGYYGDRGEEWLTEQSRAGEGFLPNVCRVWEKSADPVRQMGIRTVHPRIGLVMARNGGMLSILRRVTRYGLGTVLGNGRQGYSWVHIDDVVAGLRHLLEDKTVSGPVNIVAPEPVSQRQFSETLAEVLSRSLWLRAPAWALRLLPGGMGKELLLTSQWVKSQLVDDKGFTFKYPALKHALENLLQAGE